jgi:hypothetical protein
MCVSPCFGTHLVFFPRFLVGTASGSVLHRSRLGDSLVPRAFSSPDASYDGFYCDASVPRARVTCLEFSPHTAGSFLTGFADGRVGCVPTARLFGYFRLLAHLVLFVFTGAGVAVTGTGVAGFVGVVVVP